MLVDLVLEETMHLHWAVKEEEGSWLYFCEMGFDHVDVRDISGLVSCWPRLAANV